MHTIAFNQLTRGLLCLAAMLPLACPAAPLGVQDGALIVAVDPGDTLFGIASDYLRAGRNWHDLQQFNQIRSAYRLRPGTRLRIPLAWAATEPSSARVLFANGRVSRVLGPHASIPLTPGMILTEGGRISSAPGASATLELVDHSRIRVLPDTTLVLSQLRQYRHTNIIDTVIRFSRGQVESSVDPAHRGIGRYEVNSPLAVTGVRGTQFRVGLRDHDSQMTNEVLKGVVAVQGAGSATVSAVTAGQGTIVGHDGKVQAPRPLLPAPSLRGVATRQSRPIARFAYAALPGAVSYRAIVARDRAIDDILQTGSFKGPVAKFAGLPDGRYYLAVSGVD
ncbi:MAG: FecR domain-containing protein, partial [Burkholderiales bacterium]|nr:FecR domain-containing protein [Burkholderiales bacterium]